MERESRRRFSRRKKKKSLITEDWKKKKEIKSNMITTFNVLYLDIKDS